MDALGIAMMSLNTADARKRDAERAQEKTRHCWSLCFLAGYRKRAEKRALRKLEASEAASTLSLPREEEARLLAELARGSSNSLRTQRTSSAARDPHCVAAQDFIACAPDEISMRRGDCVRELYRDGDWSFVATTSRCSGFVPSSYLKPIALLFNTNPAQEQMRAKTFERNNAARASVDSRRSTSSWGSSDSNGAAGMSAACASSGKKRLPSSASARELWVPPRGKSDPQSQNTSRTSSPRPSSAMNGTDASSPRPAAAHAVSPSNLVTATNTRNRPTSCTPTRLRRHDDAAATERCGSATGWSDSRKSVTSRRSLPGTAVDPRMGSRRATSMRNVRVATAKCSAPRHVRMAYNFEANNSAELSVSKGEEVVVLEEDDDWLMVKIRTGQQGRVPKCMTTSVGGQSGGLPSIEPLPRDLIFNKPATSQPSTTVRDSVATDITDDSAIATGDEASLVDSRRSSVAVFEPGMESPTAGEEQTRCVSPRQFSTLATRHNSPVDNGHDGLITAMSHDGSGASTATKGKSSTLPAMSSAKSAMLDLIRAREAHGDQRPRLVVMFDYTALVADEMDVKAGDIVLENSERSKAGWAWAVLPRTDQEGYIPLAFTHPHDQPLDDRQVTAL